MEMEIDLSEFQPTAIWAEAVAGDGVVVFISPALPTRLDRVAWMEAARCDSQVRTGGSPIEEEVWLHDLAHGTVVEKPGRFAVVTDMEGRGRSAMLYVTVAGTHTDQERLDIALAPLDPSLEDLRTAYPLSCRLSDPSGDRQPGLVCIDLKEQ